MYHNYPGQQEKQEHHSVATGKGYVQEKQGKATLNNRCTCSPLTYARFSI